MQGEERAAAEEAGIASGDAIMHNIRKVMAQVFLDCLFFIISPSKETEYIVLIVECQYHYRHQDDTHGVRASDT